MDQLAHDLTIDPVDFHLQNVTREFNDETPYTSWALRACITDGAERFDWSTRWRRAGTRSGPVRRGVGMALGMFAARLGRSSAVLRLEQGHLWLHIGVTDIGTGAKTAMAQLAAEAMEVDLADVTVVWGDTDRCPYSVGESGSRTTTHTGQAILEAAEDLKRQVSSANGPLGSRTLIAQATPEPTIDGLARYASAAHFVEVEIDTELGDIRVRATLFCSRWFGFPDVKQTIGWKSRRTLSYFRESRPACAVLAGFVHGVLPADDPGVNRGVNRGGSRRQPLSEE